MDAASAKEKFDAGARLVQIYTGFVYRGPQLVGEIPSLNSQLSPQPLLNARLKSTTFTLGHRRIRMTRSCYTMAENKIDMRGYRFTHILQDIQTLNERATRSELHITAVSIHALAYVLNNYALLPSGASMGDGYGPYSSPKRPDLSVTRVTLRKANWLLQRTIAIPGAHDERFPGSAALPGAGLRTCRCSVRRNFRGSALRQGRCRLDHS